jgi:hypothetical protein
MGLIGWLRLFLKGYTHKSHPLNNLTKKGVKFVWTPQCQHTFDALKSLTTSYPTLAQPDLDKPLEVEVDASNFATGAALIQCDDRNKPRPIAYRSQTLNQAERSYNIYNKELLAVMCALWHWRHYLQDVKHQVIVHTDHEALLGFKEPKNINRRLARYVVELANYNIVLKHIPGKENKIADALSRQPDYDTGKEDNKGVVVLPETMFIKATTQEDPPSALCHKVITTQTSNFALLDCYDPTVSWT